MHTTVGTQLAAYCDSLPVKDQMTDEPTYFCVYRDV